jgi:hypothetical protein
MIDVYRAGWQLTKVKGMMLFSAVCAAGALYWGWDLFTTVGLRPADGGVLRPLWERLAWGLGVAGLGVAFLAGMWVYGRMYATRIRYDAAADALHIGTLEFLATREKVYPASAVLGSSYHHGRIEGSGVNAPWFTLQIEGRNLALIVDAQGRFPDRALAARLFKGSAGGGGMRDEADEADGDDFHHLDLPDLSPEEGRRLWRRVWLTSLREYADAESHAAEWLGAADPEGVHGFADLRIRYLDDLNLAEGGYAWAEARAFVSGEEAAAMAEFHRLAAAYEGPADDERYSDKDYAALVLDDPTWRAVVDAAKRAQSAVQTLLDDPAERRALAGDAAP